MAIHTHTYTDTSQLCEQSILSVTLEWTLLICACLSMLIYYTYNNVFNGYHNCMLLMQLSSAPHSTFTLRVRIRRRQVDQLRSEVVVKFKYAHLSLYNLTELSVLPYHLSPLPPSLC